MSESCDVAPDGDRALPIIVRWRRGPEILLAVGLIMLAAGSLWVVLAARSVPPSAMRSMGILAVLFLMWSLVRRAWGDSRADPESPRARDLLDRWPLLVAAWAAGGAYLVFFSPTLSPLAMRIIGLVGLSFFGFLGAAWFNFRRQHPVALRLDETGFLDNTTLLSSPQPIPWTEVQGVAIQRLTGNTWIVLMLVHPARFVSRQAIWRRPGLRANWALVGSPVALPADGLDLAPDVVVSRIQALIPPSAETTSAA